MYDIFQWCDENITYLKRNGIEFQNGFPVLPSSCLYREIPKRIETFDRRGEIPPFQKRNSLLAAYSDDARLISRVKKLDRDLLTMTEYGGITGFDLSPSIGMLRPRQKMNILISQIYDCRCALAGIKILPNFRIGDFGTTDTLCHFPADANFIVGRLGTRRHGFLRYGDYQLRLELESRQPPVIFVYGSLSSQSAGYIANGRDLLFCVFPDRHARVERQAAPYMMYRVNGRFIKDYSVFCDEGGAAT